MSDPVGLIRDLDKCVIARLTLKPDLTFSFSCDRLSLSGEHLFKLCYKRRIELQNPINGFF
jgi:hypothetical protein